MMGNKTILTAAALAATLAFAGAAQAASIESALQQLANAAGTLGDPVVYNLNDDSRGGLIDFDGYGATVGDIVLSTFIVGNATRGDYTMDFGDTNSPFGSGKGASVDVEVYGRAAFKLGNPVDTGSPGSPSSPSAIFSANPLTDSDWTTIGLSSYQFATADTIFEVREEASGSDRSPGFSEFWGTDFTTGSVFAEITGTNTGKSFDLYFGGSHPTGKVVLSNNGALGLEVIGGTALASTILNIDPILDLGTNSLTITPQDDDGDDIQDTTKFSTGSDEWNVELATDQAVFGLGATIVPLPAAVWAGIPLLGLAGYFRRRMTA